MNLEGRKAGTGLKNSELTDRIIAAAIALHRELEPGFIESVYEEALALEFVAQGIPFERQKIVPVSYRGQQVGEHRLDFLVAGIAVVELKAAKALEDVHFAIVRSYMKACSVDVGLLFNFAAVPLSIRRVGRERSFYQNEANEPS